MSNPAARYEIGANGEAVNSASQIHAAALAAAELARRRPNETIHVYDRQAKAGTVCLWNWDRSRGELTPVARVVELPVVSAEKPC